MKQILFGVVAVFAAGAAQAQMTPAAPSTTGPATTVPTTPMPAPAAGTTAPPTNDSNQAVATTSQDAMQPAKGSNSFTAGQARERLEAKGFTNVTGLEKDPDGIWRGQADRNGMKASVWVDYRGNVGPL